MPQHDETPANQTIGAKAIDRFPLYEKFKADKDRRNIQFAAVWEEVNQALDSEEFPLLMMALINNHPPAVKTVLGDEKCLNRLNRPWHWDCIYQALRIIEREGMPQPGFLSKKTSSFNLILTAIKDKQLAVSSVLENLKWKAKSNIAFINEILKILGHKPIELSAGEFEADKDLETNKLTLGG